MIPKLAAVIGIVVILMLVRAPLVAAITAGAILIGILFPMPALEIGKVFLGSIKDWNTINLLIVVYLISMLGKVMREVGGLDRFSRGAEYLLRGSRVGMVMTPMFVGLLPMPGGALLTAPMVEEQARPHHISPGLLTYLNFWFRHVWEYFWPLYPPILLGMAILGIPYSHFLANQSFMTPAAILVGSVVLFSFVKRRKERPLRAPGKTREALKGILYGTFPVIIIMILVGSLNLTFKVPVSLLMLAVVVASFFIYRIPVKTVGKLVLKSFDWKVLTLLVAVMFFKDMLTSSPALDGLAQIMQNASSTFIVLPVILLPFVVGLLIGLNQAYVAASFPILAPFISAEPGLIMLAYVFGFMGCLLSPAHLCLAFSREYFKASWLKVYAWLLPSVLVLAGIALGAWFLFFK
ncbi:DUF401 family protein [candidate division WOR-3 bacterium]|nr:DUF401 family protein [candidate division WOR-3 bacterium]